MSDTPLIAGMVLRLVSGRKVRLTEPNGISSWQADVLQADGKTAEKVFLGASELLGASIVPAPQPEA